MKKETDLDIGKLYYLTIRCERCNRTGFIIEEDKRAETFIVCPKCGWETCQVWCNKCHKTWNAVENIEARPYSWVCPNCNKKRHIFLSFYDHPVDILYDLGSGKKIPVVPRYPQDPLEKHLINVLIWISLVGFLVLEYIRIRDVGLVQFLLTCLAIIILVFLTLAVYASLQKRSHVKQQNPPSKLDD